MRRCTYGLSLAALPAATAPAPTDAAFFLAAISEFPLLQRVVREPYPGRQFRSPPNVVRRMRRFALAVVIALLVVPSAQADGVDQTCELTATRFDADTVNVLFPDSSAQYWTAHYTAVPGTHIRVDGIYPYARYTSWNFYDPVLRPFTHAADIDLLPDAGSANPFLPGADRTTPVAQRHYTMYITFDPAEQHPGHTTVYLDPSKNPSGFFTLRVYVPDKGLDVSGGVGAPQVTWEQSSATAPPAVVSPCTTAQKPTVSTI